MSSIEKRELQFSSVIDRGEALISQHHAASKTIESHLQVLFVQIINPHIFFVFLLNLFL